jgi:predicted cupin superfamily sugar epimerase
VGVAALVKTAKYWIDKLDLIAHPEGGYYRESYRAALAIGAKALPREYAGARAASTAIYFLLAGNDFSALHRLRSDELWHFYDGGPLAIHVIDAEGQRSDILLGNDPERGDSPQAVVKAGCWFGTRLRTADSFALVGCTVAPGFDFADFELGDRAELLRLYPQHGRLIEQLTRA